MCARRKLIFLACLAGLMAAACTTQQTGLPNPASVYCEENGGRLDLRTSEDDSVAGVCVFPDGSECDEWAFYRGTCAPGDSLAGEEPLPIQDETLEWVTYHDAAAGIRFAYPADAVLSHNDDPLSGLSVIGPLQENENWPMFFINFSPDREEYRPPEGVDLTQWLIDHSLLGVDQETLPDVTIAGATAIHLHHAASPQSYASDSYFFTRGGQLYNVVILHTADRQDWELYSRFLDSIQFDD